MPQAGKGDVGGGDPHALLGGLGEYRFARRLNVVFNGNGGVGKRDSRDVDDVTPDQKRLAIALNQVEVCPGVCLGAGTARMPGTSSWPPSNGRNRLAAM
jgi:hypothetical protein